MPLDLRPMLFQHLCGKWVNLNLPLAIHPSTFKPEIKTANASEQTAKR
jgi:hypothetical protein